MQWLFFFMRVINFPVICLFKKSNRTGKNCEVQQHQWDCVYYFSREFVCVLAKDLLDDVSFLHQYSNTIQRRLCVVELCKKVSISFIHTHAQGGARIAWSAFLYHIVCCHGQFFRHVSFSCQPGITKQAKNLFFGSVKAFQILPPNLKCWRHWFFRLRFIIHLI
jgi:hypothetical protein